MEKLEKYCLQIKDGEHGSVIDDENGSYYLLSNKNLINGSISIIDSDRKISKDTFETLNKRLNLEQGDVLISSVGTIGKTVVIDGIINYAFQRSVGIIKPDKRILNPYYLKYILDTPTFQKMLMQRSNGGVQKGLYIDDLKKLELPIPNINIQNKIVDIVLPLDSKINLNNKLISELESLAKTIYDYWFLQFEFPNEEGKPYKSSGGKMIWSEELKREIPEGWGVGELSDVSKIAMGSSPTGDTINEEKKGVVFYQGCSDFGYLFPAERTYTTNPLRFANEGDILFSVRAPVGDLNFALTKCCIGRGVAALSSDEIGHLFFLMKSLAPVFTRYNRGGTTFGDINKDALSSIKIAVPPLELRKSFERYVNPSLKEMKVCEEENRRLTELRDYLLPMLMNGQVGFIEGKK